MRRFLTVAFFVIFASGTALAYFPLPQIIYDLLLKDGTKLTEGRLKELIKGQYWLRSDSYGSSQRFKTDHVKDPFGKSQKGELVPAGSSVDKAWGIETGDPRIVIAIIDTGIQWDQKGLINKLYLNKGELPPLAYETTGDEKVPIWDVNGDGALSIADFGDPGCELTVRDENGNGFLDPQDLILTKFGAAWDGKDNDGNGFVDDICGWDFFENDNDADDVSSYTSTSKYHGTGQAHGAGGEFLDDEGYDGEFGTCPNCMIMPLKTWDSFVQDTNHYGLAVLYAANNRANVIEGALGGLSNSGICRDAVEYAYKKGMAIFMVSSDINSANHNWPTYLNEPIYCSGMVPDNYIEGADPASVRTWYRNSGLCQYGPKNQISFEVSSGSHSTSLSSGAGGLLISHALKMVDSGQMEQHYKYDSAMPVHPDQIKQLLTMTAEDVVPEDTQGLGEPDPSQVGWDQHFGYGRVNLFWALELLNGVKSADGKEVIHPPAIPPVARITAPQWSQYLDPRKDKLELRGDVLFAGTAAKSWTVEAAYGVEPADGSFDEIATGSSQGENMDFGGPIGLERIRELMPKGLDLGYYPKDPDTRYRGDANIQANRHMFTVRLKVVDGKDGKGNKLAEDRRTFFLSEDKSLHHGWPKFMGVGGEAAPRFEDLDGDNLKEIIIATSDGRIFIYRHDGTPFTYKGKVIEFAAEENDYSGSPSDYSKIKEDFQSALDRSLELRSSFVTPAVADIDNDGIKEIVDVAGDKVYCFKADGRIQPGFPKDFSVNFKMDVASGKVVNSDHNSSGIENNIGPGALAPPVVYDINNDGFKEIIVGSQDGRVYAWDYKGGECPGWPVYSRKYDRVGQKIIYSPCIADLDGDGRPELVVATNEVVSPGGKTPIDEQAEARTAKRKLLNNIQASGSAGRSSEQIPGQLVASVLDTISNLAGKDCLIYAIRGEGNGDYSDHGHDYRFRGQKAFVEGWPVSLKALLPDILPHLGPSTKPAAFDYDNDKADEIVASATSAQTAVIDGDGSMLKQMKQSPMGSKAMAYLSDHSLSINLYDSCAVGNLDKDDNIEIAQGGLTFFGALNLFISGQNFPFNHVMQVWDSKTGGFEDAFPRPVDDFILYAEPAIADVDGDGVNEVLTGSGLFLLHAIGMDGLDRGVFPRLTGGWIMMTPAIDDIDGDGKNEVAAVTREGGIFIWDTEGRYTAGKDGRPQTWPAYGHDNWNTSNLGNDAVAPAGITEYEWTEEGLTFKCPGDDGFDGRARELKIYGYSSPINSGNWKEATLVKTIANPVPGGTLVYVKIPNEYAYYAVIAKDEKGNATQLMLEGGPMTVEQNKVAAEDAPADDGGGGSGWCFIGSALGV